MTLVLQRLGATLWVNPKGVISVRHALLIALGMTLLLASCNIDVDIGALVEFHRHHGGLATMTTTRPPSRFGHLSTDGDRVTDFVEKPISGQDRVNGGFFVLSPKVGRYIQDDRTVWECEPMERLAADDQLYAFQHDGFWQPMDTLRDKMNLDSLWCAGNAPWKVWK